MARVGHRSFTGTAAAVLAGHLLAAPMAAAPDLLRVGDALPSLEGSFLTGRHAALPEASAGRARLILMGFTYASRKPVEAWSAWFQREIGVNGDATFFEVPMIGGGFATLGRWFINRGMRNGTPVALHENVITVYSSTRDWKKRLGVTSANERDAFLVLIDRDAVVRWLHHGEFDTAAADDLRRAFASLQIGP